MSIYSIYGFSLVMYGYESCNIKKTEHQRIDAFEQWCWITLLRVPWAARRSNQWILKEISSVQSLSRVRLFATQWTAAHRASLSITNSWSLLKLVHQISDAIQPAHPLSSPSPPAFNMSLFQWLSSLHQVAKCLKSILNIHRKDWFLSWNSNTLAIWREEVSELDTSECLN